MTRCLPIFLLVLALASSTPTARAEPASAEFSEVIAKSETIAIVALTDCVDLRKHKANLKIQQVYVLSWARVITPAIQNKHRLRRH